MVIPEKYEKGISAKIEAGYKRNPSGTLVVVDKEEYKIDFKTMTETCLTSTEGLMKVYRRPCEGIGNHPGYSQNKNAKNILLKL